GAGGRSSRSSLYSGKSPISIILKLSDAGATDISACAIRRVCEPLRKLPTITATVECALMKSSFLPGRCPLTAVSLQQAEPFQSRCAQVFWPRAFAHVRRTIPMLKRLCLTFIGLVLGQGACAGEVLTVFPGVRLIGGQASLAAQPDGNKI